MTAPLDRYAAFWETLTPDGVEALDAVAAPDFRFVDPFNDVAGRAAVKGILRHMFETLEVARFAVTDRAMGQGAGFLKWTFDYRVRGRAIAGTIVGVSEVRFGADGLATAHVDHWDAASQLYERVPVLGGVLRMVKRRLSA